MFKQAGRMVAGFRAKLESRATLGAPLYSDDEGAAAHWRANVEINDPLWERLAETCEERTYLRRQLDEIGELVASGDLAKYQAMDPADLPIIDALMFTQDPIELVMLYRHVRERLVALDRRLEALRSRDLGKPGQHSHIAAIYALGDTSDGEDLARLRMYDAFRRTIDWALAERPNQTRKSAAVRQIRVDNMPEVERKGLINSTRAVLWSRSRRWVSEDEATAEITRALLDGGVLSTLDSKGVTRASHEAVGKLLGLTGDAIRKSVAKLMRGRTSGS